MGPSYGTADAIGSRLPWVAGRTTPQHLSRQVGAIACAWWSPVRATCFSPPSTNSSPRWLSLLWRLHLMPGSRPWVHSPSQSVGGVSDRGCRREAERDWIVTIECHGATQALDVSRETRDRAMGRNMRPDGFGRGRSLARYGSTAPFGRCHHLDHGRASRLASMMVRLLVNLQNDRRSRRRCAVTGANARANERPSDHRWAGGNGERLPQGGPWPVLQLRGAGGSGAELPLVLLVERGMFHGKQEPGGRAATEVGASNSFDRYLDPGTWFLAIRGLSHRMSTVPCDRRCR